MSTVKGRNYLHRLQKVQGNTSTEKLHQPQPTIKSPVVKFSHSLDNPESSNTGATDIKRLQKMTSLPAMPPSTLYQSQVNVYDCLRMFILFTLKCLS